MNESSVCEVQISYLPWMNGSAQYQSNYVSCSSTNPPPRGGFQPYNTTLKDPKVQFAVKAINDYFRHLNPDDHANRTAVKLLDSKVKVLRESVFNFTISLHNDNNHYESDVCRVQVLFLPWQNESSRYESNDVSCVKVTFPPAPGSCVEYNTTLQDPKVEFSVHAINDFYKEMGDNRPRTAVKIIDSCVKILKESIYNFTIEVTDGDENDICDVQVLYVPFVNRTSQLQLQNVSCQEYGLGLTVYKRKADIKVSTDPPPPGDWHVYNTTLQDPKVIFAVEYINQYYNHSGAGKPRTAVQLLGATTQIVNGQMFIFLIEVTDGQNYDICHTEVLFIPWLNGTSKAMQPKGITCYGPAGSSTKRSAHALVANQNAHASAGPPPAPGSWHEYNTTLQDPKVVFAVEVINKYYQKKGDFHPRIARLLIDSREEVVSGFMYNFTILNDGKGDSNCSVEVLYRPWLNGTKDALTSPGINCTAPFVFNYPSKELSFKYSVAPPPGYNNYNTTLANPKCLFAVKAINQYYNKSGDSKPHTALKLLDSYIKTVVGHYVEDLYQFTIVVTDGTNNATCVVSILTVPFFNITSTNATYCNRTGRLVKLGDGEEKNYEQNEKTPLPPGGWHAYNTTLQDPKVVFAAVLINGYYQQKGDFKPRYPRKLIDAQVQTVNGFMYNFTILNSNTFASICSVEVLYFPWLNGSMRAVGINCSAPLSTSGVQDVQIKHSDVPRKGYTNYNTTLDDPKCVFAVKVINEYYNKTGEGKPHTAVKLLGSFYQFVQGHHSEIYIFYEFDIIVTDGLKKSTCTVDILNEPLLNYTIQNAISCTIIKNVESYPLDQIQNYVAEENTEHISPIQYKRHKPPKGYDYYNTTLADPKCVFAVKSINDFYNKSGHGNPHTALKLLDAFYRIVRGHYSEFFYNFEIVVTDGTNNNTCTVDIELFLNYTILNAVSCYQPPESNEANVQTFGDGLTDLTDVINEKKYIFSPRSLYHKPPAGYDKYNTTLQDPACIFAVKAINEYYNMSGSGKLHTALQLIDSFVRYVFEHHQEYFYKFTIAVTDGVNKDACTVGVLFEPYYNSYTVKNAVSCNRISSTETQRHVSGNQQSAAPQRNREIKPPQPPPPGSWQPYNTTLQDTKVVFAMATINKYFVVKGDKSPWTAQMLLNAKLMIMEGFLYNFTLQVTDGTHRDVCISMVLDRGLDVEPRLMNFGVNCTDETIATHFRDQPPPGKWMHYNTTLQDPKIAFSMDDINNFFVAKGDTSPWTTEKLLGSKVKVEQGDRRPPARRV